MTIVNASVLEQLYRVPENGKAEIVNGRLMVMEPTGFMPGRASHNITSSLCEYERRTGLGYGISDNVGFLVDLPHRKSFSPDAAFFTGAPTGMRFLEGAPALAVEVRSEGDYGPSAERAMDRKRADYFAAGTLVVWDVDLLGEEVVRVYRADDHGNPTVYRRGEVAEAEPATPGWTMPVDELFE